ncbi:hypothetical protein [Acinetobacter pollinis]|uniref:DUF904 domain-containing protein n=1 Tax=Acinetobacter pollinis TaxID=2605270 RepID=A0ABU6DNV7_9GAMM|nr:hypothetical protein [Acinetobacter pollinis]MEB5475542.1 hypothetical protein [Acinetobacter pollinis]
MQDNLNHLAQISALEMVVNTLNEKVKNLEDESVAKDLRIAALATRIETVDAKISK